MTRSKYLEQKAYLWLLFLLSPFISLVISIRRYEYDFFKNILWFFIAFYGYTMVISDPYMDANRLIENFHNYKNNVHEFSQVIEILNSEPDFFMPFFNYIITRFIDSENLYLLLLALFFGFFYSRCMWVLVKFKKGEISAFSVLLLLAVAFSVPFWQINGFRFWTSAIIFFYGIINSFLKEDKKNLLWCLFSVTIHFSFLLPVGVLFFYLVVGNKVYLYYMLYVISFFFLELSPELVNSFVSSIDLPMNIQNEIMAYSSESYVEKVKERSSMNWYITIVPILIKYTLFILFSILLFKYNNVLKSNKSFFSLYSFSILLMISSILISSVPSGSRFLYLSFLISFSCLYLIIQNNHLKLNSIVSLLTKVSIFGHILVMLRIGFDTISISTILGNPFFLIFDDVDLALIDLIK